FVLTTIDAGTRIARFLVQEFGNRLPKSPGLATKPVVAWLAVAAVSLGCVGTLCIVVAQAVAQERAKLAGVQADNVSHPALLVLFLVCTVAGIVGLVLNPNIGKTNWQPGSIAASLLVVSGWAYFIYTGSIQTLWPMFGVANQLLAVVALAVGTTVLINEG